MLSRRHWLVFALLLSGCSDPVVELISLPAAEPRSLQIDPELRQRFREAFAEDFEFGDDRLQSYFNQEYWLVALRPKRAGMFLVGCEFRMTADSPSSSVPQLIEYDHARYRYYLPIEEKGMPRFFRADSATEPLGSIACLGDTIVVPIPVSSSYYDYRFFRRNSENESEVSRREEELKRNIGDDPFRWFGKQDSTISSRLNSRHFELVSTLYDESLCRTLDKTYSIGAVLKATAPGRFNLLPTYMLRGERHLNRAVPMLVVPRDAPLTVFVSKASVEKFQGKPPANSLHDSGQSFLRPDGAVALRVGDQIMASCWHHPCIKDKPELPAVTFDDAPFKGVWAMNVAPNELRKHAER